MSISLFKRITPVKRLFRKYVRLIFGKSRSKKLKQEKLDLDECVYYVSIVDTKPSWGNIIH